MAGWFYEFIKAWASCRSKVRFLSWIDNVHSSGRSALEVNHVIIHDNHTCYCMMKNQSQFATVSGCAFAGWTCSIIKARNIFWCLLSQWTGFLPEKNIWVRSILKVWGEVWHMLPLLNPTGPVFATPKKRGQDFSSSHSMLPVRASALVYWKIV
jgi:hypothetical protein